MGTISDAEWLVELDDRAGWESALEDVPHAFAHTWDNCNAMAATTGYSTSLYCLESEGVKVVCPLAERPIDHYSDIVTPYGFSGFVGTGKCPELSGRWQAFAERSGYVCAYLVLNPLLARATELGFGAIAQPHRTLFVLDLARSEQELLTRMSQNRRRQLRHDDELLTDRDALADFFVDTYPAFAGRRDAAAAFTLNRRSLVALCESPQVFLIGARRGGQIRAVSLFGFTPHAGDFLYNASLPGEEHHSAALIWAAVRELKVREVPTLNLGGGVVENDGVAEFKRRFGADQVLLHNIKQVYRSDVYAALCAEAGVNQDESDYFPAYRTARAA